LNANLQPHLDVFIKDLQVGDGLINGSRFTQLRIPKRENHQALLDKFQLTPKDLNTSVVTNSNMTTLTERNKVPEQLKVEILKKDAELFLQWRRDLN